MKSERNIFVAFILNFAFAVFEFVGGIWTGSVAIASDALHDFGDSISIGFCAFLEKKSKKKANDNYTYGYSRFSALGSLLTTIILTVGSILVVYNAIERLINPTVINYDGMIIFAVVGVVVNFIAYIFSGHGKSLNQKLVSLHMLEDVLGWVVVLVGAIVIKFTGVVFVDPILSICVAVYILYNALRGLSQIIYIFTLKVPEEICVEQVVDELEKLDGVEKVYHLHVWELDEVNTVATLHVVVNNVEGVKARLRDELKAHGISHVTIETQTNNEQTVECDLARPENYHAHHHHSHAHSHGQCKCCNHEHNHAHHEHEPHAKL